MKNKNLLMLVLALSALIVASCSDQQAVTQPTPTKVVVTPTAQSTVTVIPTEAPTVTPTPRKAEGFENCERIPKFENVGYYDYYGINTQGDMITHSHITHDDSSWKINKMGVTVEITNPQVIDGLVYFSINGAKITMTEGAILNIRLYKDPPSYDTAYPFMYSPTTNSFIMYSPNADVIRLNQLHLYPAPGPYVHIYPDSTVSLTNIGGITGDYQGNYCVEQDNDAQCVIYTLPNGDEYGYGVNKDGEVSCMQLWMEEETETE